MFTRKFCEDAAERAIRAGAWSLMSFWGVAAQFNILGVDWRMSAGMFGGGVALSLVGSLVGSRLGDRNSAALLTSGGGRHEKP